MITLIYGGSASGKSSFAEQAAMKLSPEGPKYYIATMQVYGEEGKRRVERHVKLREGKGFQTIECPVDITDSLQQIPEPSEAVLLIECISNLVANEMFDSQETTEGNGGTKEDNGRTLQGSRRAAENDRNPCEKDQYRSDDIAGKVTKELQELCRQVKHTVIVTNNIFEDGVEYAKETVEYIQCLGQINQYLAKMADQVIEVIAGIPVSIDEKKDVSISDDICDQENAGTCKSVLGSQNPTTKICEPALYYQGEETENKWKGAGQTMRLIIGGTAQGKRKYVTEKLKSQNRQYFLIDENEPELSDIPQDVQTLILDHLHLIIRKFGEEESARAFLRQVTDFCETTSRELIIISDEVGNGIVPLEKEERDYREHVGRILCDLAQEATTIERVICGIPMKIPARSRS